MMTTPAGLALSYRRVFVCATTSSVYEFLGRDTRLLGRWTRVDFSGGFDLLESDDPKALTEFALMWSDLMGASIVPVLEDQELSDVLQRIGK
jgi:uncharacterized protein DUF3303